jgi:HEAT repeat protein
LLRSPDPDGRLRAIQRLGGQNDYAAVQILLQALGDDPALASDPRMRLEAVRALAPFASRDPVRHQLISWATDTSPRGRSGALGDLARDQAAMALAASSNSRAVDQLVLAVIDGGEPGERASNALRAHPPRSLEPLLHARSLETPRVVELLGEIGDLRAIPKLRQLLVDADIDVKVAAAFALAQLGDASGVKLARDWIAQDGSSHGLRVGAARTLTLTRDPFAPRAIAILLADSVTRDVGLALAEAAPTPQLAPTLAGLLTISHGEERTRVLVALARAGGPLAVRSLATLVQTHPVDSDAAFALAHCRDPQADSLLSKLLADPKSRRVGARASILRTVELGQQPDGLVDALETLASSRDETDRSLGVFGLVLMRRESVDRYASQDEVAWLAACRASLGRPTTDRKACAQRLSTTQNPVVRDGLAGTLIGQESVTGVSTTTLLSWAESTRVSAPIFGRALGPRDAPAYRTRIERLLLSGDADVRSQLAIGLGQSPQPSAVALLIRAYAFETDPMVRRAIMIGLASGKSAVARPWLERAAQLDPDDQVRSLARHGLAGRELATPSQGAKVLWLRLVPTQPEAMGARPVRLVFSNGFATVAVTAPDGQILVPGVTSGDVHVRVDGAPSRPDKDTKETKETKP